MPPAGLHQFPDPAEKRRIVFLNPSVKQGLIVIEYKSVSRLAKISGNTKGGKGLGETFRPLPQPDRIDMRVAYEMKLSFQSALASLLYRGTAPSIPAVFPGAFKIK